MRFYWLALGVLVTWRITHLLQAEDGPWNSVARLRRFAGEGFWGGLLVCFYCLSVWVAVPLALWIGEGWRETVLLWPTSPATGSSSVRRYFNLSERNWHRPNYPSDGNGSLPNERSSSILRFTATGTRSLRHRDPRLAPRSAKASLRTNPGICMRNGRS